MTRLSHFTDVWFYSTAQREREKKRSSETKKKVESDNDGKMERRRVKEQEKYHCTEL